MNVKVLGCITVDDNNKVIEPGSTIGILGGGQLGRMIILAGKAMGYRFVTLDPHSKCPAAQVSDDHIVSKFDDFKGADYLGRNSEVITYEFENVDSAVANRLEEKYYLPQGSLLLKITQNRSNEKSVLRSLGLPVAPFEVIKRDPYEVINNEPLTHLKLVSKDERRLETALLKAVDNLGMPAVMKTTTGGYDGKGQWFIRNERDFISASNAFNRIEFVNSDFIVEKFVPFERELSVIVARNKKGEIETYPVAENIHNNSILHMTIVPARIPVEAQEQAQKIAKQLAIDIDLIGLLAIEMFYKEDGTIYINELAPRPHNSGHYTMDACMTSQFEQHVRAICNLPLGKTDLLTPVVMVNLLGQHIAPFMESIPNMPKEVKFHLYGKSEAVYNRKMGHINVLSASVEDALSIINNLPFIDA
ncbi:5-(carboxyamino)imidazole ribonucleotide synthase [Desulfuribacillus alkaliarsenatis]|uniref:5-(carboxyamino)imidazole ribonucleotide synthase n=1 Tax=Desulfuribacillus alkaliarsenatis TaxID=766136 RepID=UPI000A0014A8